MIKIVASTLAVFLYGANAQTAGPAPATPATPSTPSTPQKGGAVPFIPFIPEATQPTLTLECTAPYTMIGKTCAGTIKEFTNPVNEFKIGCTATGACAQTDFIFNYDANYYGERINQIVFSETYAGYMATITLDNQSPYSLYIDVIKCSAVGACQEMQIRTIGASINDMQCDKTI